MTENEIRQKLKDDYSHYAKRVLKILDKETGKLVPFVFNEAQVYANQIADKQLKETGMVRLNVLKGRQQGISTNCQGRAYWRTSNNFGYNAFILTHLKTASQNLFNMTKRYHDNCKDLVKPKTGADSTSVLSFPDLDSQYAVGTAGNKNAGVSTTNRFVHGSEVALWENAGDIAVGLLQTVPLAEGTEIWRESTARGMGNYFHTQWKLAEAGESDYWNVFIPWYWSSEYSRKAPDDFEKTDDEIEVCKQFREFFDMQGVRHRELTNDQLNWRRFKIAELNVDGNDAEQKFKQEYPMNSAEAFMATTGGGLISPKWVTNARANNHQGVGATVLGVDPAFGVDGGDRFSIAVRQGRCVIEVMSYRGAEVETTGQRLSKITTAIKRYRPDMIFIDAGGGYDLANLLQEKGHKVKAIPFASTASNEDMYVNKRAEMWGDLADWLNDEAYPVNVPDSDSLHADLCASLYTWDSNNRKKLHDKKYIKKKLGFSPDEGDAVALTFAEPVLIMENMRPVKVQGRR